MSAQSYVGEVVTLRYGDLRFRVEIREVVKRFGVTHFIVVPTDGDGEMLVSYDRVLLNEEWDAGTLKRNEGHGKRGRSFDKRGAG